MDAVLLAAGLGTRLRPLTLTTPKPLLPIQGRPILDWIVGALPPEVDRLVVVVNYLAEQIESYLAHQSHHRNWVVVTQGSPRGTGDALRSCRGYVRSDRFLVLNGDDLYGASDLASLARCSAGLLAAYVDEPRKYGIVFTKADGTLEKLVEKPDIDGRRLANAGAYVFPQRALDIQLQPSVRGEYEIPDVVVALAMSEPFLVIPAHFWRPIGTVEAWETAQHTDLSPLRR